MRRLPALRALRRAAALSLVAGASALSACGDGTDTLLEAVDPDIINPTDLTTTEGALALYVGTFNRARAAYLGTGTDNGEWLFGGLLADEWSTSSTFIQNDEADQRKVLENNSTSTGNFRGVARVRTAANQALKAMKELRPTETNRIGELYFHRGFAELQLASDFCNGIPISDASGDEILLGTPESVAQVLQRAVASFDSALAVATGTDATSLLVQRASRVGKARALLALGNNRAAEAAALVTATLVPTSFSYELTFSATAGNNNIWGQGVSNRRYSVGDSLEGNARNLLVRNAIPFFSARDPRLPVTYTISANQRDTTKGQDGFTFSRTTPIYLEFTSIPMANGLDARLIEAEARLIAQDIPGMMTILNALRASPPQYGAFGLAGGPAALTAAQLPPLATPASQEAAINLYFREKAFWTFSRGQRLGDLRRLIRSYGRTAANTFPQGPHYRGGDYGGDLNFPVPTDERVNSAFTGCTNRSA
ncbi:hypothetical protein [Roseisolibacter sp. H3M3-2]|uniref:hypothetical protein n=1 Tax=Roseisolibacter sp. H3M3-2 TaxID=3031323 RepID=UPI0023DBD556|nr:hypothetical protein [Roseisolibacter sp. H3M3-2]MDF1501976.1 hypothetical protein [Roseisolibacter sp. H3M3-2]